MRYLSRTISLSSLWCLFAVSRSCFSVPFTSSLSLLSTRISLCRFLPQQISRWLYLPGRFPTPMTKQFNKMKKAGLIAEVKAADLSATGTVRHLRERLLASCASEANKEELEASVSIHVLSFFYSLVYLCRVSCSLMCSPNRPTTQPLARTSIAGPLAHPLPIRSPVCPPARQPARPSTRPLLYRILGSCSSADRCVAPLENMNKY